MSKIDQLLIQPYPDIQFKNVIKFGLINNIHFFSLIFDFESILNTFLEYCNKKGVRGVSIQAVH